MIFSVVGIAVGELRNRARHREEHVPRARRARARRARRRGVCFVIWMLTYTTRQKETVETDLRRSEERFRAMVENVSDVILVLKPTGHVSYTSPALLRLLGYERLEHIGTDILPDDEVDRANQLPHAGHRTARRCRMDRVAAAARRRIVPLVRGRRHQPSRRSRGVGARVQHPRRQRAAGRQEQLRFQAYHDALTRLPNRWQFLERLESALFDAATHGRHVAVMFLDVDRFKLVNDTLGHDIGDRLLVHDAERLQSCLRPDDIVARFGGDEFSVLLAVSATPTPRSTSPTASSRTLREPVIAGEHELFVSSSIGIAISHEGQVRAATCSARATSRCTSPRTTGGPAGRSSTRSRRRT